MSVHFVFPPHPSSRMKCAPPFLDNGNAVRVLEEGKMWGQWDAQRKYNGSHMVASVYNDRMDLWNRQGEHFTTYTLTASMHQLFISLNIPKDTEVVFDGELLHTKAKSKISGVQAAKDTIVLYDLLYYGKPLLTETYQDRYDALTEICHIPTELEPKKRGLMVDTVDESQLWLAELFHSEFEDHFYDMYDFDARHNDKFPEIEGLVCKKRGPESRLKLGNRPYDVEWIMRVRKTKEKVYLF